MISKFSRNAILMSVIAVALSGETVSAQFPNWKAQPVRPRIDVIPPLGNHLPYSYRARMNRPSNLSGRIAYTIEPTSQEAMAWQRAWERGYYANHAPRMETHYMFPKPWEVLGVGAKPKRGDDTKAVYPQPERLPLGPAAEDKPAGDTESQVPGKPVKPEKLDTPEAESAEFRESVDATPALVPRLRDGSRSQVDAPGALELAPAIELSPVLTIQ